MEKKKCPRCDREFECRAANVSQCGCSGVRLTEEQRAFIEERYRDCLCVDCLVWLSDRVNLFREKYIFRG